MSTRTVSRGILSELLELIYPVQYKWGFALEDVLRFDALTRMQVVILWLIRCEGEDGRSMRRREIQTFLVAWFEASNSTVTKTLRSMARAPLNLVKIVEHPESGREKNVVLTAKGEQFFGLMLDRCQKFLEPIAAQFSENELREGIRFLKKWLSSAEALSLASFPKKRISYAQERDGAIAPAETNGIAATSARNLTSTAGRETPSSRSRRIRLSRGEIEV